MKLRTLRSVASVYMTLVAFGFIFLPRTFGAGAVPEDASSALIACLRLIGSPLPGIAVLDWMTRHVGRSGARDAIILGNRIGFGVTGLLDVWGLFSGGRPATKVFVVIHLLFALACILVGRKNWSGHSDL